MGEKGNLLDTGEGIFANLAEQGPQFWLGYKQYMDSRNRGAEVARVIVQQQAAVAEPDAAAQEASATRPAPPATG